MLKALADAVLRHTNAQRGENPYLTAIEGFAFLRSNHEKRPSHLIMRPALCITVQGAKWTMFGAKRFRYGPGDALLVGVEMPAIGRITQASPKEPYLGIIMEIDLGIMREVVEGMGETVSAGAPARHGAVVVSIDGPIGDCVLRAVRLLDNPQAIPILYPAIMREICYWLVAGDRGREFASTILASHRAARVIRALHVLRERFAEPVRMEELAAIARLSPSAFHRHFKRVTSMSPLQYQKRLRLLEARRLMVSSAANAETAAFRVGYESPSQFNREYSRMFGVSPKRDALTLRGAAA